MSKQFYFKQFSLTLVQSFNVKNSSLLNSSGWHEYSLVLFDPLIGAFQVLPLRARGDLGTIAMKGYSAFPKAPALLEPLHQIVCVISRTLVGGILLIYGEAVGAAFCSPNRIATTF